ncbi:T5orf172 domain-containing protein [Aspergillus fruticulosus]
MPAKEKVFVPFRLLLPSDPEYRPHCPAITGQGLRCKSKLKECNIPQIRELLTKVQDSHEDTTDDETRETTLRRIAKLSICGHQIKSIEAAVRQWVAETRPRDSHLVGPQTPQTPPRNVQAQLRDNGGGSELVFTPYRRDEIEAPVADELSRELNRMMDENIGVNFLKHIRDSEAERGYLYIFDSERAKGMYKVGRTKRPRKRGAEQDKCYRGFEERRSIHCPNAKLFERIIQLEFAQYRYEHYCGRCDRFHTEWFKAPFDDIVGHINLWSHFSRALQSGNTFDKLSQVTIPLPGTSSDPNRWYKWALGYVEKWRKESPVPQLGPSEEPVVNKASGPEDLEPVEDTISVPGLSPSSSTPGTPSDDFTDPPTPTPSSRTRQRKFTMPETLSIPEVMPSEPDDIFFTPVEDVSDMPSIPTPESPVRIAGFTMELPVRQKAPPKLVPTEQAEPEDETVFD